MPRSYWCLCPTRSRTLDSWGSRSICVSVTVSSLSFLNHISHCFLILTALCVLVLKVLCEVNQNGSQALCELGNPLKREATV